MGRDDISVICAAQIEDEEKNSNILCQKKMQTFVVRFTDTMAAVGLAKNIRVGRVTGNTAIFFFWPKQS